MNPLKTSGKQIFARYKNGIKNITKEKNRSIQNHKTIKSLKQQFKFASMMNSSNGFSFAVPPTFVNSGRGKLGSKMYENNMNRFFNNNTPKMYVTFDLK